MVKKIKLESSFRQPTEKEVGVAKELLKGYANKRAMSCMNYVRWSLITLILAFFLNNVLLRDFELPRFVTIIFTAIALVSGVVFSISMVLAVRRNLAAFSINGGSIKVMDCKINASTELTKVMVETLNGTVCSDEFNLFVTEDSEDIWEPKFILAQTRFGGLYAVIRYNPNEVKETLEDAEIEGEENEEVEETEE